MDITAAELKTRLDKGEKIPVLDVREPYETQLGKITDLVIPMGEVALRISELEPYKDSELIVCCRSGSRSGAMVQFLKQNGFSNPRNLAGGMMGWQRDIDPNFQV